MLLFLCPFHSFQHMMFRCIRGLLHNRIVVLVTHQVQFALQADKILALKEVCCKGLSLMSMHHLAILIGMC